MLLMALMAAAAGIFNQIQVIYFAVLEFPPASVNLLPKTQMLRCIFEQNLNAYKIHSRFPVMLDHFSRSQYCVNKAKWHPQVFFDIRSSQNYSLRTSSILWSYSRLGVHTLVTCKGARKAFSGGIAQWQSIRLQSERSLVQIRVPPIGLSVKPCERCVPCQCVCRLRWIQEHTFC